MHQCYIYLVCLMTFWILKAEGYIYCVLVLVTCLYIIYNNLFKCLRIFGNIWINNFGCLTNNQHSSENAHLWSLIVVLPQVHRCNHLITWSRSWFLKKLGGGVVIDALEIKVCTRYQSLNAHVAEGPSASRTRVGILHLVYSLMLCPELSLAVLSPTTIICS